MSGSIGARFSSSGDDMLRGRGGASTYGGSIRYGNGADDGDGSRCELLT